MSEECAESLKQTRTWIWVGGAPEQFFGERVHLDVRIGSDMVMPGLLYLDKALEELQLGDRIELSYRCFTPNLTVVGYRLGTIMS